MGFATLVIWCATVLLGLYMLLVWLIEYDPTGRDATATRLPGGVVFSHLGLAVIGLVVWSVYLLTDVRQLAWFTVGGLTVIAMLGLLMFLRWIPVHRGDQAVSREPSPGGRPDQPPESHFPQAVVACHGVLAVTTYVMVVLTTLNVIAS